MCQAKSTLCLKPHPVKREEFCLNRCWSEEASLRNLRRFAASLGCSTVQAAGVSLDIDHGFHPREVSFVTECLSTNYCQGHTSHCVNIGGAGCRYWYMSPLILQEGLCSHVHSGFSMRLVFDCTQTWDHLLVLPKVSHRA